MLERLQETNEQAALKSSRALSKLIDRPVNVEILGIELKAVEEISLAMGPEAIVAGIYMPVAGDVTGFSLLILPKESSFAVSDLLHKREPGTTRKLTFLDESALKEVGNIISGNYFAVFSNRLGIKIIKPVPRFSFNILGAIINEIATRLDQSTEQALVMQLQFEFERATFDGYFLVMFEPEQMKAILGSLD